MKRFISLSAAIMMGTVLSKEHAHKNAYKKAIAKAENSKNLEFLVQKKDSVESFEELEAFNERNDKEISDGSCSKNSYQSPETSKQKLNSDESSENHEVSSSSLSPLEEKVK